MFCFFSASYTKEGLNKMLIFESAMRFAAYNKKISSRRAFLVLSFASFLALKYEAIMTNFVFIFVP